MNGRASFAYLVLKVYLGDREGWMRKLELRSHESIVGPLRYGATTLRISTFNITTLSTTALSTKGLFVTLSINDTQHNDARDNKTEHK